MRAVCWPEGSGTGPRIIWPTILYPVAPTSGLINTAEVMPDSATVLAFLLHPPLESPVHRQRILCPVLSYTLDEPALSHDIIPFRNLQLLGCTAKMTKLCLRDLCGMLGFNFWLTENRGWETQRGHNGG